MEGDRHRLTPPVSEADWRRGPEDALVTLLEYADFQCPCCQGSFPVLEDLLERYDNRVRFVARPFPVTSLHPRAEAAARVAEAAGRQGRFWEMYAQLFQSRGRLDEADFELYARRLGLDLERLQADREDEAVTAKLREHKWGGLRSGVNGTPTLFLNGLRYEGAVCPVHREELKEALEAALADAAG